GPGRRRAAPLPPASTAGHSSGQVLPRDVLVGARLGRQAQDTLGDDVQQDLAGPALDAVALGAQVPVTGAPPGEVDELGPAHGPVVVQQALLAEEFHFQAADRLVEAGEAQFHPGALGAGLADGELLAQPFAGEAGHLGVDPQGEQPLVQVVGAQVGPFAPGPHDRADHAALAGQPHAADGDALVVQGGLRDPPSVTGLAQAVGVGYADVGEEDLVELGLAGDLAQRPHLDAGVGHVADEVGDAPVL